LTLAGDIKEKILASLPAFLIYKNGSYENVTVTPVPTTTYTAQYLTPFNDGTWDFGKMTPIGISTVGDFFGQPIGNQIVTGWIILNILGIIWIRQDDAAIPLFLLWGLSVVFFGMNLVPSGWVIALIAFELIVTGGIAYTLYRGRRNS
jgi:hypothetical protein